jgi:hypothetical protein
MTFRFRDGDYANESPQAAQVKEGWNFIENLAVLFSVTGRVSFRLLNNVEKIKYSRKNILL